MNKKTIGIIVLIAVLIIVVIGVVFFIPSPEKKVKTCKELNYESKNYILAIKNQDIGYCGNTGNPDFCIAQVKKDASYCDTQENREHCLAIITSNEKFCDEFDFWCKADASGDVSYCNELPEIEQEPCIAETELNPEYYDSELC